MAALFLSDVHLSAARPALVEAFTSLMAGPARSAGTVYILGDLFDQWLGDDDEREPHPTAVTALADLARSGTEVGIIPGNHDFLLGRRFERETGCRILDEPWVTELDGRRAVLLHGDTLCTRDADYQAFRRFARDPENQAAFLAMPMAARLERAAALRQSSREQTELKPDDIMDVTPADVEALFDETGAEVMIHGHTHRPAVHRHESGLREVTRYVLADWYSHGSYLWLENGEFEARDVRG